MLPYRQCFGQQIRLISPSSGSCCTRRRSGRMALDAGSKTYLPIPETRDSSSIGAGLVRLA